MVTCSPRPLRLLPARPAPGPRLAWPGLCRRRTNEYCRRGGSATPATGSGRSLGCTSVRHPAGDLTGASRSAGRPCAAEAKRSPLPAPRRSIAGPFARRKIIRRCRSSADRSIPGPQLGSPARQRFAGMSNCSVGQVAATRSVRRIDSPTPYVWEQAMTGPEPHAPWCFPREREWRD